MDTRFQFVLYVGMVIGFQRLSSAVLEEAFSGINYARNKNATQEPNTLNDYIAALAVDGNINTRVEARSCSHTFGDPNLPSYWTIDLGLPLYITGIIIYNRADMRHRLKNIKIYGLTRFEREIIYDDDEKNMYLLEVIRIKITATQTYSSIQIWIPARVTKETILTLCKVEVYGGPGCEHPEILENGFYLVSNETECELNDLNNMHYLCNIKAHCNEGYKVTGSVERLCTSNGNWSDVDPYCSIVQCNIRDLGNVANGNYVLNGNNEPNISFATYMQTASVVCTTGFRLVSDSTATCTSDGVWNRNKASCVVTCLAPMETTDVKYKIWHNTSYGSFVNAFPFGAFSEVICVKGILKAGSRIRHCKSDGLWDGDDAVCVPLCNAPEATNGILRDDNNTRLDMYEEGQTLSLTCFEGFTSETGQRNLTCLKNHSWNALPICSKIPEGISSTSNDLQKAVIGGLSGGLAIAVVAAVAAVGAFLIYFLRWQRKKNQDAEFYTRLRAQQASNIESDYAKIQETIVT